MGKMSSIFNEALRPEGDTEVLSYLLELPMSTVTIFSVPAAPGEQTAAMVPLLERLLKVSGQDKRVEEALRQAGKTMENVAQDHNGPLPVGGLLITGIPERVELGASISFLPSGMLVTVPNDNKAALNAMSEAGYRQIEVAPPKKTFAHKRGWLEGIIARTQEPDVHGWRR